MIKKTLVEKRKLVLWEINSFHLMYTARYLLLNLFLLFSIEIPIVIKKNAVITINIAAIIWLGVFLFKKDKFVKLTVYLPFLILIVLLILSFNLDSKEFFIFGILGCWLIPLFPLQLMLFFISNKLIKKEILIAELNLKLSKETDKKKN